MQSSSEFVTKLVAYLNAGFVGSAEFQAFFMALQGAMIVRNGLNDKGQLNWFHAFVKGVVISYAGALFTPLWMGRPTSMLSSDMNMAMCIIAYSIVNCIPFGIGHKIGNFYPIRLLTVMGAQLFRSMGMIKFVDIAYEAFKDNPSAYYPTPIFGPILNGTILANMGSFFAKGFDGHVKDGLPFPFQNGLFCASVYHFVAHDDGPVGLFLKHYVRMVMQSIPRELIMGISVKTFVITGVSLFMQINGILQMPEFFGPTFSPFDIITYPYRMLFGNKKKPSGKGPSRKKAKKNGNKQKKS